MGFIASVVIISLLLVLIGVSVADLISLALIAAAVIAILTAVFFAICVVLMALSKRVSAEFCGFDESGSFPRAVYLVNGEQVPNIFPAEMVMRDKLYAPEKQLRLLYCRPIKLVIDTNAFVTMVIGAVVFIPAAVFAGTMLITNLSL